MLAIIWGFGYFIYDLELALLLFVSSCLFAIAVIYLIIRWVRPDMSDYEIVALVKLGVLANVIGYVMMAALVVVAAAAPFLHHHKRRRRFRNGLCLNCGHNLHAHKTGQRCPECGSTILSKYEDMPRVRV